MAENNSTKPAVRKNTRPRNLLLTQGMRLDFQNSSKNILNYHFPPIVVKGFEEDPYQQSKKLGDKQENTHQLSNNNNCFESFIDHFRKNPSSMSSGSRYISPRRDCSDISNPSNISEMGRVTGFKRSNESVPPRVSRLLHAVEDRDAKQSKELLKRFTNKEEEKEYTMPRNFSLENFKLIRSPQNIPKIKNLMCHFINNHKKFYNKDVVRLPGYDKSAPFFVDSMTFADKYLDDQRLVKKSFGYDEENLNRNGLLLEKILLERLVKKEKNIPDNQQKQQEQPFLDQIQ